MTEAETTRTLTLGPGSSLLEFAPFVLHVVDGPDRGREAKFDVRCIEIGSDIAAAEGCRLVLSDRTVSRQHCRIEAMETGYRLEDQGSRNGTLVDGCRVEVAWLRPGVQIRVGQTTIRFDLESRRVGVELGDPGAFGALLGVSAAMRELFGALAKAARSSATVVLEGESGTGKELAARAIHQGSERAGGPFEVFDCAAVPPSLAESELFGHEKGAFTGAAARREGVFARAHGGTLFLDEIGELPEALQPKLLRVLDSREFRPLGGARTEKADVRIVAATHRDLAALVREQRFRLDLFHRLAVMHVRLPPLRHRPDDIPLLVDHFLEVGRARGHTLAPMTHEVLHRLRSYPWPGNVRELRNFVERGALLGEDLASLPFYETVAAAVGGSSEDAAGLLDGELEPERIFPPGRPLPSYRPAKETLVDRWEAAYCRRILDEHDGNVTAAAQTAGLHRKSLEYLLFKHGIQRRK